MWGVVIYFQGHCFLRGIYLIASLKLLCMFVSDTIIMLFDLVSNHIQKPQKYVIVFNFINMSFYFITDCYWHFVILICLYESMILLKTKKKQYLAPIFGSKFIFAQDRLQTITCFFCALYIIHDYYCQFWNIINAKGLQPKLCQFVMRFHTFRSCRSCLIWWEINSKFKFILFYWTS